MCLQVLESGGSASSSVLFEYRARNASSLPSSQLDWLSLDGQSHTPGLLSRGLCCFLLISDCCCSADCVRVCVFLCDHHHTL